MGIALYEAVKYFLRKQEHSVGFVGENSNSITPSGQQMRGAEVDIVAGARQTDHLERMKENALSWSSGQDSGDDLAAGTNPGTPLTGEDPDKASNDPWKKSLANDELRAPDS